ncbi:hypothetical protein Hbl1158_05310 [Halobaculum sp. CBA1158]|uniref:hypothetical protein n=1 Tax=Halobaculum sp. CBA1158 TaxID=2904243 RepID=UPI001F2AE59D|nr:hypothetical protein [Halobaculum sp. CBA1158]UIP00778.1 hypothetical protein Hbl1158_05310 [Halobaculum sp. CBA1158]
MNGKAIVAVLAVVVIVAVGGAAAFVAGIGPIGDLGGGSDESTATPQSTGTVYDGAGGSNDGGSGTEADSGGEESIPPYTFAIQSIDECGQTCRDVTVRLDNNRDQTAEDVSVFTQIYAGNSTDSGDRVWQGNEDVGSMEPQGSVTRTSRVELSYSEGYQVQQEDGWITIVTTVESADVTITFRERRQVL